MIYMRGFVQGQNLRASLTGVYKRNGAGKGLVNATNWESYCEHKKKCTLNEEEYLKKDWFFKVYCNN